MNPESPSSNPTPQPTPEPSLVPQATQLVKPHRSWRRGLLVVPAVAMLGVASTVAIFAADAFAWTTLYKPNANANATVKACRATQNGQPILRLQYTGNDSPFITMKTTFGPSYTLRYKQPLTKYTKNWVWNGSYNIPSGASSVRVILTFDDNTSDKVDKPLKDISSCSAPTATPVPPTNTPIATPKPTATPSVTPKPSTTPAPTPTTTPKPTTGIKPLTPGTSWQWQLTGTINETILDGLSNSKKMYDIDLYDTPATTISRLKAKGIAVVCYFSAGSAENWRPDYNSFPASVKGKGLDGWAGETWLDVRQLSTLKAIMGARMDLAVSKGCDGIEPDNVDAYTNDTGFPLTAADQLAYNRLLATEAHARKLSVGLKNDVDQVPTLAPTFDWALNEQCYQYSECGNYSAFVSANKAVFGVEYKGTASSFCPKANAANFDWLLKDLNLGATPRTACRNG
jgi:hypothetical protein